MTASYKCQPSSSSPVSFSASREVGRRPLPPSSSSFITFFTTMRTFLLIVAVSLSSAANVKREADAEATAEADASADPGYGRHHGHAGQTEDLKTDVGNSETWWAKPNSCHGLGPGFSPSYNSCCLWWLRQELCKTQKPWIGCILAEYY